MPYEVVIGLEVHAQLQTESKMFCACKTTFGAPPNTQTCPVCLGMPGTLPVINEKAIEMAVKAGLALNCSIRAANRFARKNYFYPDLPKGYQISQYEAPICEDGAVELATSGGVKRVRIKRAHLEEDAGKNVHDGSGQGASLVDLNRAGTPLLEIVTEPDMRSPDEVVSYLKMLRDVLVYLDVCDGNMEQGSLRCEPNLSLRPVGTKQLGTKVELKNINSFRFVKDAIEYEIKRQTKVLEEGGTIQQETRLWNSDKGVTASMRSKEEAHDYRYFPDPDLVPLKISEEWISQIRSALPRLPTQIQETFVTEYSLPPSTASVLIADRDAAGYFLDATPWIVRSGLPVGEIARELANWATVDLRALLNERGIGFSKSPVNPQQLFELIVKKYKSEISGPTAKAVLAEMFNTGRSADEIVTAKGLTQVSDEGALEKIIEDVLAKNQAQVVQYRSGKETVLGFFVGQVMKASGGKANPGKVNELLKRKLAGEGK